MEKKEKKGKDIEKEKDYKARKLSVIVVVIFFIIAIIFTICLLVIRTETTKPGNIKASTKKYESEYKIDKNSLSDFDLMFLKYEKKTVNKIYSPLSIKYALGMLYEATDGDSRGQIEAVIGDYNFKKYSNSKHISFVNTMFVRDDYSKYIRNSYINSIKDKYDAEVKYDSFENAKSMNKWISNNTFGLINNALDDNTVKNENYELINALAIDMEWNKKIQATYEGGKKTVAYGATYKHESYSHYIPIYGSYKQTMKFKDKDVDSLEIGADANKYNIVEKLGENNIKNTLSEAYDNYVKEGQVCEGDENKDKVINKFIKELKSNYNRLDYSTDFYFLDDDDVKVFAKDLKKYDGRTLQYVSIMPKNKALEHFIYDTNVDEINSIIKDMKDLSSNSFEDGVVTRIEGNIPVFNYDYELSLEKDLKHIGIGNVFDQQKASLNRLLKESQSQYISSAVHKANIDFSNDGIKAAAVTSFGGAGAAGGCFDYFFDVPVKVINLDFDQPYMYLIRDKDTNEVWFIGAVFDPSK